MERWDDTCSPAARARRGPSDAIFQGGGHMFLTLCKSKLHRATVTQAELHYVGSITIDSELLAAAEILPFERVQVVDIANGARFETYAIEGSAGSRTVRVNGAAARLVPEEIARPVRAILRRQSNAEFRMTEVTGLDASGKRIVTADGPIAYDYLILAVGGQTNYFGLESVPRHGFGLKDIPEAIRIRNHVLHSFERALLE